MTDKPADVVSDHDKQKRLERETEILDMTNHMDDLSTHNKVTRYLVEETQSNGRLLRVIVDQMMTKEDCKEKMASCPAVNSKTITGKEMTLKLGKLTITGGSLAMAVIVVCATALVFAGKWPW